MKSHEIVSYTNCGYAIYTVKPVLDDLPWEDEKAIFLKTGGLCSQSFSLKQ